MSKKKKSIKCQITSNGMQYKYVEYSYSTLKYNFTSVFPLSAILYFIFDNFSHFVDPD